MVCMASPTFCFIYKSCHNDNSKLSSSTINMLAKTGPNGDPIATLLLCT